MQLAISTDLSHLSHNGVQESTQQQQPDFALSLLRVIFTLTPLPASPLLFALTEDILLGMLLRQQGSGSHKPSTMHEGAPEQLSGAVSHDSDSLARHGSYTEVSLATPIPTDTVSAHVQGCCRPTCLSTRLECVCCLISHQQVQKPCDAIHAADAYT